MQCARREHSAEHLAVAEEDVDPDGAGAGLGLGFDPDAVARVGGCDQDPDVTADE